MTVLSKKENPQASLKEHERRSNQSQSQINTLDKQIKPPERCIKSIKNRLSLKRTKCLSQRNLQNDEDPNNSADEYDDLSSKQFNETEWNEQDHIFEKKLNKRGFILKQMENDGACLFRSVSDQLLGDQNKNDIVRKQCMDYVSSNKDFYMPYITEDFNTYIARKRLDHTHGNHVEIHAMSELYNRKIEVYCYDIEPINIFNNANMSELSNPPIRLSYQRGNHYNSIIDPRKDTRDKNILEKSNFRSDSVDKQLLNEGIRQSENLLLEQAMLEDKLKVSDWQATDDFIQELIARESYLQFLKDNEKRRTKTTVKSSTETSSSTLYKSLQISSSVGQNTLLDSSCSEIENRRDFSTSKYEDNIDVLKELSSTLQEEQLDILPNQQVESDRKCIDLEKPSTSE